MGISAAKKTICDRYSDCYTHNNNKNALTLEHSRVFDFLDGVLHTRSVMVDDRVHDEHPHAHDKIAVLLELTEYIAQSNVRAVCKPPFPHLPFWTPPGLTPAACCVDTVKRTVRTI